MPGPVLAVHGGAGRLPTDAGYRDTAAAALRRALEAGLAQLRSRTGALEAAVAAAEVLEDCPVMNAGRGSVLTCDGGVEMDAAVMDGAGRRAGGVAGVRALAHPVRAALCVLRDGRHVLLAGDGAERFARERGCAAAEPEGHVTPERRAQLEAWRARSGGTVGAVALDAEGHLAAATSTGGTTGKLPGRVSDSCLIGSGTWADDATCAVSATGLGELFIRSAFAHEVDALLRLGGLDLDAACRRALERVDGRGGCIAVDCQGRVALPFGTPGMARGWADGAGRIHVEPA
jgi:isoaspartyl peptidase/L-asparaginase-like protein (Ntn-hydrolase superfamily)